MQNFPSYPVPLQSPCKACGHKGGLLIRPHPKHQGLIKCGVCDTYQGKYSELKSVSIENR